MPVRRASEAGQYRAHEVRSRRRSEPWNQWPRGRDWNGPIPGGQPGRPIRATHLGQRLKDLGIQPGQVRSTALFQLATELPAALLARMLGIHIDVAVAWQRASAGDWMTYAADVSRRQMKGSQVNPQRRPPAPTQRLTFREMTADDLDDMAALLGDSDIMRYYPRPKDREEVLAWIEWNQRLYRDNGFGLWLITLRATGEFVGDCGLTPQDVEGTTDIEIGYHVRAELQGRGYATEAAAACRDYARNVLNLDRLIAIIAPDNVPSQRVAIKLGLTLEREAATKSGSQVRVYATAL